MAFPDIKIGSKFDAKGFKQAETASTKLEKGVKNLAKSFAVAFSATAVLNFGKAAVKAFGEDEKSAAILANTMKNLGLQFQNPAVETFIAKLSAATGEIDDNLRPAMQKLLQVTGSVSKSQKLLTLALDVAAGSGQSLDTVVSDLTAAQSGNTKGLKKYALGLTAAQLKTIKFEDVTAKLAETFAGSAATAAETFTGQMKILTTAAGEAQETIGKGLVDAFKILAGTKTGIEPISKAMGDFAQEVSDTIVGLALLIKKLKEIPVVGKGLTFYLEHEMDILKNTVPLIKVFADTQKILSDMAKHQTVPFQLGMSVTGATDFGKAQELAIAAAEALAEKERLAKLKADKAAAALKVKGDKAAAKAKEKADKAAAAKDLALKKASANFDLTKISIAAALKNTYDKDERLRLLAMQAIEEENGEAALSYIKMATALTTEQNTNKLNGIKTISETELNYINQLLLDELQRIKTTKMSEEEAALARQEAYRKYNAAIVASGGLAEANFYTEKTQVELLQIAKLASLDKVAAAQATMDLLNYTTQKTIIERIAAAQKIADDAKYKALEDYLALLAKPIQMPVVEPPPGSDPKKPRFGVGGQPIYEDGWNGGYSSSNGSIGTTIVDNSVIVNIDGLLDEGAFDDIISRATLNNIRRGLSQSPAGSLPGAG
jgi:hypothetical protein